MLTKLFAIAYMSGSLLTSTPSITTAPKADPNFEKAHFRFERYFFEDTHETAYITQDTKGKDIPEKTGMDQIELNQFDKVDLTGTNQYDYWKISVNGKEYYVDQESLTTDQDMIDRLKQKKEEQEKKEEASSWNGPILSASAGVNQGPSGKETYYNLPMEGVVSIMRSMGNNDPYWIREDGAKMLGDYVMVAAHLNIRPRGTIVETSLGKGIVCDTGGFASGNPTQLDIATTW
ncbi:hypothetical protein C815_01961 [Firmicutes bacterium M10-2]|nr:hypothetical protein C815_01961 [Firmicutes bacterium M10-2]